MNKIATFLIIGLGFPMLLWAGPKTDPILDSHSCNSFRSLPKREGSSKLLPISFVSLPLDSLSLTSTPISRSEMVPAFLSKDLPPSEFSMSLSLHSSSSSIRPSFPHSRIITEKSAVISSPEVILTQIRAEEETLHQTPDRQVENMRKRVRSSLGEEENEDQSLIRDPKRRLLKRRGAIVCSAETNLFKEEETLPFQDFPELRDLERKDFSF